MIVIKNQSNYRDGLIIRKNVLIKEMYDQLFPIPRSSHFKR